MSELRVPTTAHQATVFCADGREFEGSVFVPESSQRHGGGMRVVEMLNDASSAFFPFRPRDGQPPFLLNKREIVVMSVAAAEETMDDEAPPTAVRMVVIELEGRKVQGAALIDLPEAKSRVLDWVNRPETFLVVQDGDRHHLVQKERITRILEVREE
jgi:hypothetical protein